MRERFYFWKRKSGYVTPLIAIVTIVTVSLALIGGAYAWWYYDIKVPAEKKRLHQLALRKQQADLAAIASFYKKSLAGVGIPQAIDILAEVRRNTLSVSALGLAIKSVSFECDTLSCAFGFKLQRGAILTLPVINFFGKTYPASIPVKREKDKAPVNDFEYTRAALPYKESRLLKEWQSNRTLSLHSCNEIISYVNSYNSLLKSDKSEKTRVNGVITYKSYPASSVKDKEKALAGQLKVRGLRSAAWEMQINDESHLFYAQATEINAQIALYKQAYRDAFLIRKIESNDKGIKISGGLVCKA
ncbi:hypothetical protein [Enterobacter sp. DE0047]|uniref:hypothetical protein n=1 Tax=Enterobacter sp. DE0047 TaxID=2584949 RepID=UPI00119CB38D|nr:hypothetical protein [Enterobacter sp. DE0047]